MKPAVLAALAVMVPAAAQSPQDIDRLLTEGVNLRVAGKYPDAAARFSEARDRARAAQVRDREALATLQLAVALDYSGRDSQAESEYRQALELNLPPTAQAAARNNLAYLLVRVGGKSGASYDQAFQQFDSIPYRQLPMATVALYLEHYASLLMRKGSYFAGFEKYCEALRAAPSDTGWTAAFDAAHQLPSQRWVKASEVLEIELQNGMYARAVSDALVFLDTELAASATRKTAAGANEVLERLLRGYAGDPPDLADFQRRDLVALQRAAGLLAKSNPHAQGMARELIAVFDGSFPIPRRLSQAENTFPHLLRRPERERYLALLLKNVGAQYRKLNRPADALPRLAASWWIDPGNAATALNLAVVLHDNPGLDPHPSLIGVLSSYYVTDSFRQKASRLATDSDPGRIQLELGPDDWGNLVQMYGYLEAVTHAPAESERKKRATDIAAMYQQRQAHPENSLAGDRFISRHLERNQNISRVQVLVFPNPASQNWVQATAAVVDADSQSFFGVFDRPLARGQSLQIRPTTPGAVVVGEKRESVRPSLFQDAIPNLTASLGLLHGHAGSGSVESFWTDLQADGAFRSWHPSMASPDRRWFEMLERPSFHGANFMLRYTASYRLEELPVSAGPSGTGTERRAHTLEATVYAPIFAEDLAWRVYHSRYLLYVAPLVHAGWQTFSGGDSARFLNQGLRIGWMRSPLTLRAAPTEFRSYLEVTHGTGMALRQLSGAFTEPQQTRFALRAFLFASPLVLGLDKTIGPGPRDYRLYLGLQLNLASSRRLLDPRPPAE